MLRNIALILAMTLLSTPALAEGINGRLGLTGKVGLIAPLVNFNGQAIAAGFVGGVGLIYGLSDKTALEFDVTHAPSTSVNDNGSTVDMQTTDLSIGIQYRFMSERHLVPYVGAGIDFITGSIVTSHVNWAYGGHLNAGVDYFLNKSIAVTADFKYIAGTESDIVNNGKYLGKYNPMSFVGAIGFRLFLRENWAD